MSTVNVPPQTGQISTYAIKGQKTKQFFSAPNPFEQRFGYHRAIRRGPFIFVSGTTALRDTTGTVPIVTSAGSEEWESKVHYPHDARLQAMVAMERCIDAIERLGGTVADVVRVKMFVARHKDCGDVGAAFKECFSVLRDENSSFVQPTDELQEQKLAVSEVGATATMIVVQDGFVDPDILVEVEVDAVVV